MAGQYDFGRRGKPLRTIDHLSGAAQVLDRLEHRAHVAAAVIDEGNHENEAVSWSVLSSQRNRILGSESLLHSRFQFY
ncbi:MAG: hypothetical protein DMG24_21255 [Acidobacteria bacterium]|nr:MAG: hypothetical protein DMG24_21255 [Acidobacteriota bacterium]